MQSHHIKPAHTRYMAVIGWDGLCLVNYVTGNGVSPGLICKKKKNAFAKLNYRSGLYQARWKDYATYIFH